MRSALAVICIALVLATPGCGLLEPKPPDERSEGRRPGLFSGESGRFVVRRDGQAAEEPSEDEPGEDVPAEQGEATSD